MNLDIPRSLLLRAAEALRQQAHMEAGSSQAPDLIKKEDTQAWKDRAEINRLMREAE